MVFVNKSYCDDSYTMVHNSLLELRKCYDNVKIQYHVDSTFCVDLITSLYDSGY